jgi:hypothetical protein
MNVGSFASTFVFVTDHQISGGLKSSATRPFTAGSRSYDFAQGSQFEMALFWIPDNCIRG